MKEKWEALRENVSYFWYVCGLEVIWFAFVIVFLIVLAGCHWLLMR